MTKVIPVLRSGDFEDPVINRSISLLPILSKVCKKISLSSICSFFEQFRKDLKVSKRKSSSPLYRDSLASLFWGHFKENGLEENLIDRVLDMSKALDSIQDERLLMKLHNIGVSTSSLTWLESYFTQHSQFVRIEDATFDLQPVRVPQGSILGPVLFTVYVNDPLLVVVKR